MVVDEVYSSRFSVYLPTSVVARLRLARPAVKLRLRLLLAGLAAGRETLLVLGASGTTGLTAVEVGKVVGYAYAEGWAHYTEEMMWEAGLSEGDAATHIGQLSNALRRDCNGCFVPRTWKPTFRNACGRTPI